MSDFYTFRPMQMEVAKSILNWKYPEPYDLYNMTDDQEDLDELMDGSYYVAFDQSERLIGYICFGETAQVPGGRELELYNNSELLDIGLGVHPNFTGKGLGKRFLDEALVFGKKQYNPTSFRLSVATFNQRAISVYQKVGFVKMQNFYNQVGEVSNEFLLMVRK